MWPFKSKAQKDQERYDDGFNWAAGQLLRDVGIPELELKVECALHFNDYDQFDSGIEDAIEEYKALLDHTDLTRYKKEHMP